MTPLTMHAMCTAYGRSEFARKWPDSQPYVSPTGRWLYGHWAIGNLFTNGTRYPGAYPRTYVERVRALFPGVRDGHVLHLFAGSVPKGAWLRLDLKPELGTELVGSVYDLPALLVRCKRRIRLVMADPPYTKADALHRYGTPPVDKARAMRAIAAAVQPGTHVVWLDSSTPQYRADQWTCYGDIDLKRSTNNIKRSVTFFERRAA
jgi:hypothetical protein